jgi:hypothetical protein
MSTMNREAQKWLRDLMRKEFPKEVGRATFYYHSGGIKFWGIRTSLSSKGLAQKINKRLSADVDGVKAYVGITPGGHVPVIHVYDEEARDPKLDPFGKGMVLPRPKVIAVMPTPRNVPVPYTTLLKWKQTLDHLENEAGRDALAEVKAVTAEMQMLLRAMEPLKKVAR